MKYFRFLILISYYTTICQCYFTCPKMQKCNYRNVEILGLKRIWTNLEDKLRVLETLRRIETKSEMKIEFPSGK